MSLVSKMRSKNVISNPWLKFFSDEDLTRATFSWNCLKRELIKKIKEGKNCHATSNKIHLSEPLERGEQKTNSKRIKNKKLHFDPRNGLRPILADCSIWGLFGADNITEELIFSRNSRLPARIFVFGH